jgi:hypothetical protein
MRKTNLQRQVEKNLVALTEGHVLAIDPSSGSRDSMPGYAVFIAGQLVDSGLIEVARGRELNRKLFIIGETLRTQFEVPDVLVVEHIPPFMRGSGFSKSIVALQRAIGMIIGSIDRPLLEVPPITWHKLAPEGYQKSDEKDAIMIGYAAIWTAHRMVGSEEPELPSKTFEVIDVTGE